MTRTVINNGPEDTCFGCGHRNEHGLRLVFQIDDGGAVEAEYNAPAHQAGAPGIVHGGIQATLLDEVMGMATHARSTDEELDVVTAEFKLDYLAPVPSETMLRVRGRLVRNEGRNYFLEGEIVGPDDSVLTRGEARWVSIRRRS